MLKYTFDIFPPYLKKDRWCLEIDTFLTYSKEYKILMNILLLKCARIITSTYIKNTQNIRFISFDKNKNAKLV